MTSSLPSAALWYSWPHRTKADYDQAFQEARSWRLEGEGQCETSTTAARIFHVNESTLSRSVQRAISKKRNLQGDINRHGGNNKTLNSEEEEAIRQFCYEQWEAGLGATKKMVFGAICHLKLSKRQEAPTKVWFNRWIKNNPNLHTIKTKPIAQARLASHTEDDVRKWFQEYYNILRTYKIRSAKNILNMDEAGARVGCPPGEHIVVPADLREHYTESPENRKSVTIIETIIADGRQPLPPFVIAPGKYIMDNWVQSALNGDEYVTCSPTGYTNNSIIMEYLDHLILHSKAGPEKPWKLLLLDGHESHHFLPFKARAAEHHIKLFYFPSHLTHALQPLDVGVFRPWKHWHNMAVQRAVRGLDFEYSITSFFRDLVEIRTQTMKQGTIISAFESSGMWPPSAKAGITKMRTYQKQQKRQRSSEEDTDNDDCSLPKLPPTQAEEMQEVAALLREFAQRDPNTLSSPSKARHRKACMLAGVIVQKNITLSVEYTSLQDKIKNDQKRKSTSRRHIHKGGAGESIATLRAQMQAREEKERSEKLKKAQRALDIEVKRYRAQLKVRGIKARKDERARRLNIAVAEARGDLLPFVEYVPIREPDKQPNLYERTMSSPDGYPALLCAVEQLQAEQDAYNQMHGIAIDGGEEQVSILVDTRVQNDIIGDYIDSSPPATPIQQRALSVSSIASSHASSIDSIAQNADFVILN